MAIIKITDIPATQKKHKEIVNSIQFIGDDLDSMQGDILVNSKDREIDFTNETPIQIDDGNGNLVNIYEGNKLQQFDVFTELTQNNVTIDGVTLQQVYSFLSKWTDYKKGESVDGLVIPEATP